MKQIEGNSPMCWSCYYYIEAEGKKEWFDGYCINDYNLTHGINGKLRIKRLNTYLSDGTIIVGNGRTPRHAAHITIILPENIGR